MGFLNSPSKLIPRVGVAVGYRHACTWSTCVRLIPSSALIAVMTMCVGCNRQDTNCLARIGRKVATHAKNSAGDIGSKLDFSWTGSKREPSLQVKIQDRLRWENTLTEETFEVVVTDKVATLKGTVKTPQQRLRAIELAETVAGVDKVTDSIAVREAEEAAK